MISDPDMVRKAREAAGHAEVSKPMVISAWVITVIVVLLSIHPTMNLLSSRQIMNTSFDPLDLVNTYGAFGSVGKVRYNVVFEGTRDENPNDSAQWKPYIYKGLPVLTDARSPQIAPYQLHLDWQMWFASMSSASQYPWTLNLIWKLLHNDPVITGLFAVNPFPNKPPLYIRAELYQYKFAKPGNPQGIRWVRKKIGLWLPPLSVVDPRLISFLRKAGWLK